MNIFGNRKVPTERGPSVRVGPAEPKPDAMAFVKCRIVGTWRTDRKTGIQTPDYDARVVLENRWGSWEKPHGPEPGPIMNIPARTYETLNKYHMLSLEPA